MKKEHSPFDQARPRTGRGQAKRREAEVIREMRDLMDLRDEDEFRSILIEVYGLSPGDFEVRKGANYLEGVAAREALSFLTRATNSSVRAFFSSSESPISSICSSMIRASCLSSFSLRGSFRLARGLGLGSADIGLFLLCLSATISLPRKPSCADLILARL